MIFLRSDFDNRVAEIASFINLIKQQDRSTSPNNPDIEGFKAMKAATHVLLYNLIESTATNIHELVFDAVSTTNTSFDELIEPLRRTVLRNARRQEIVALETKLRILSIDLIHETFSRNDIFSGNVDAKKIRESLGTLGLSNVSARGRKAKEGSDSLLKIKSNRNDLAHGRKTFAEVGREMTPDELERELDCVRVYLSQCIAVAEKFVQQAKYRVN